MVAGLASLFAISVAAGVPDLFNDYCAGCHGSDKTKGGFDLESVLDEDVTKNPAAWEMVLRRMSARQMPPPDRRRRPSELEYEQMIDHLAERLDAAASQQPNPGRVPTFRRLTRAEYQNAIRDLLGVRIDASAMLPQDEESHGFDNITVGTLSPALVDRYITA
ncbi:MAG: DUF1587 domain-containing protein, partial [Limisphaerales bacterium]